MASVALTDTVADSTNATVYSGGGWSGMSIGADGGTDVLYILAGGRSVASATGITSVTVDGVTADLVDQEVFDEGGGIRSLAGIFSVARNDLPDPAQIDVDVVVTFSHAMIRAAGDIFISPDAEATATTTNTDAEAGATMTLSLNTVADGIVIACGYSGSIEEAAWTGLTEQTDAAVEASNRWTTALASDVTAETPRAITSVVGAAWVGAGVSAVFAEAAVDVTAPVLSNAAATATGETTASLAVDTDEGSGTLFWVVTTSASPPSAAQVAAGQDHTGAAAVDSDDQAVAGTGTQNVAGGASGLTAGTNYWAYFVQDDAAANRSNVASDAFTTDSPPADDDGGPIPGRTEGPAGGARRRRYPFANPIDDPHLRHSVEAYHGPQKPPAEPEAPQNEAQKPAEAVQEAARVETVQPQKAAVRFSEPVLERSRSAPQPFAPRQVEPAADLQRVMALEAEVEALRTQVDELKAERRDDDEEQRLLAMLLEDKGD